MHRPHRSIEVFDISLMAVVTKAMGAFLVIMLLLMPYYSSGSIGDKSAADAARELKEAQQKLQELSQQLSGRNPQEIANALQQALDRLAAADNAINQLKHDNDALNAQAQRLDSQNSELRDQVAKAEAEKKKIRLNGMLINADCTGVRLEFGLMSKDEYLDTSDKRHLTRLLNHVLTLGANVTATSDEAIAANPDQAGTARGHGLVFDHSAFIYDAPPGDYYLVVATTAKTTSKIDGLDSHVLKHVPAACHPLISLTYYRPTTNLFNSYWIREIALSPDDYATMPAELTVTEDKVSWVTPSADAQAWLRDQVAQAQKDDSATKPLVR